MAKVLVTPRSLKTPDHPALAPLLEAGHEIVIPAPGLMPDPELLKKSLPGIDGWLAGVEKITADILSAADRLKVIGRNGVGVDNVDLDCARAKNIAVLPAPGANARGVAELAFGLMFSIARNIPVIAASVRAGGWDRVQGIELDGRRLGIVGYGQIGRLLARMAHGVGMKVVAYDLYPDDAHLFPGMSFVTMDELAATADVVSLHVPGGDKPLVDAAFIATTKKNVIIVNTARASIVDQQAVLAGLDSGHVFGYGVDAFDPEPPGVTPLTSHPRVVGTSHIGGFTAESVLRAASMASKNIVAVLA